ncbi:MAG: hypothetical protein LBP59_10985 [Planctomycetaceae bacterium]|jgi:hypothetical protein|nr:hypothetical protein [Planctomycetaceae bacterium]
MNNNVADISEFESLQSYQCERNDSVAIFNDVSLQSFVKLFTRQIGFVPSTALKIAIQKYQETKDKKKVKKHV